ncbi:HAD family hydrolase [Mangrovimonas spongiae]|uniref:HAD family phosphatase n=1 Tax=Mangrovimonas spongiae TaxID=2494697 RepID=A0A428JVY5_9FLAO|nr:HAD family phosphatase [Mangrovimonas spongiae]RSK38300.1 HAD family phosphatase [Mangrovimonas spongiae]
MIKTLIFDFGDVFINLDKKGAMQNALTIFEVDTFPDELSQMNHRYEMGLISTREFLNFYMSKFPKLDETIILNAWNCILKDFPKHRLEFLKQLRNDGNFDIILLSNTNELHIDWIKNEVDFFEDFKQCFHKFYLSHKINLRKPNADIYEFVLNQNKLNPNECLFVDDLEENTKSAAKLGINTWNINPETDDVTQLFEVNNHLF